MQIISVMMFNVIVCGGDVFVNMCVLVYDNYELWKCQCEFVFCVIGIYWMFCELGVVEKMLDGDICFMVDLQLNFVLNQLLLLFVFVVFELFDFLIGLGIQGMIGLGIQGMIGLGIQGVGMGLYVFDMILIVELMFDDLCVVLSQQEFFVCGEVVVVMKFEGIEYDEWMELFEQIIYLKFFDELLIVVFEVFSIVQLWICDFEFYFKFVVCDMYE